MPFGLGAPELIIIVLLLVVLFGWKKLPDAARSLGRSARVFRSEVDEMKREQAERKTQTTVPGETVPQADPPATPPPATNPVTENRPRTDNGPTL